MSYHFISHRCANRKASSSYSGSSHSYGYLQWEHHIWCDSTVERGDFLLYRQVMLFIFSSHSAWIRFTIRSFANVTIALWRSLKSSKLTAGTYFNHLEHESRSNWWKRNQTTSAYPPKRVKLLTVLSKRLKNEHVFPMKRDMWNMWILFLRFYALAIFFWSL